MKLVIEVNVDENEPLYEALAEAAKMIIATMQSRSIPKISPRLVKADLESKLVERGYIVLGETGKGMQTPDDDPMEVVSKDECDGRMVLMLSPFDPRFLTKEQNNKVDVSTMAGMGELAHVHRGIKL